MHNRSPQPRNSEIPKHILLHLLCKKTKCDSASTSSKKKKKGLRCSRLMLLKTRESFLQEGTFCVHSPCFVFLLCSLTCMADLQRYPLSWHHFPPESPQPLSSDSSILSRSCRCFIHNTPVNFYVLLICMCMGV